MIDPINPCHKINTQIDLEVVLMTELNKNQFFAWEDFMELRLHNQ